jgi:hypothetical protein
MPDINLTTILQTIVALGLLNVWLMRAGRSTAYRGGESQDLKSEFTAYGLPTWFYYLIGLLKVGSAIALIAGLWEQSLVVPAASVVMGLMVGALAMHVKAHDPAIKSLPALLMLAMSASIFGVSIG